MPYVPQHNPSYKQGYARSQSAAKYPGFWDCLEGLWAPSLGITGQTNGGNLPDTSGRGRNGTLNYDIAGRGPYWGVDDGGRYLYHNETGSWIPRVDIDRGDEFDGYTGLTAAIWVKPLVDSGFIYLMNKYYDGGDRSWYLTYSAADVGFEMLVATDLNNTNTRATTSTDPFDGLWHAVVGTWSNKTNLISLYVDGVLVDTTPQTGNTVRANTLSLTIGQRMNCKWGVASVSSRAWTSNEVQLFSVDPYVLVRQRAVWFPSAAVTPPAGNRKMYVLGGGIL